MRQLEEMLKRQRSYMFLSGYPMVPNVGTARDLIEEAVEVLDAVIKDDTEGLAEEAIDVLVMVLEVFIQLGLTGEEVSFLFLVKNTINLARILKRRNKLHVWRSVLKKEPMLLEVNALITSEVLVQQMKELELPVDQGVDQELLENDPEAWIRMHLVWSTK